jgi:hypothetical protein
VCHGMIICWFIRHDHDDHQQKSPFHLLRLHLCYYFSSYLRVPYNIARRAKNFFSSFKALNDGLKMIYKKKRVVCEYLFVNLQLSMWISVFFDHMLAHVYSLLLFFLRLTPLIVARTEL